MKIFIFVRQGCCLCDSPKNKLAKINLNELFPNIEEFKEIDIDRVDLYQDKYKKYDYEVPVIAVEGISSREIIELPRISPRLKDDQLKNCLLYTSPSPRDGLLSRMPSSA